MSDFSSRSVKWAYRSYEWSMWLVLVGFCGVFFIFITASRTGIDGSAFGALPVMIVLATMTCSAILSYRWLHYGVDFHLRRHQIEAGILCLPAAIGALLALIPGVMDTPLYWPMVLISAYGALLPISMFAPNWFGIVFVATFTGAATALPSVSVNLFAVALFLVVGWISLKTTLWYMAIFAELQHARSIEAQLVRAEERLRFAADLHDVVGRTMSTISLKTQLADQLLARGDPNARAQLAEISQLTNASMEEMRALVRGYRAPQLADELEGAVALLQAGGIAVTVTGTPAMLPASGRELAAHVLREATTNILRHSRATKAAITLSESGVHVWNNHPKPATERVGTGIASLRERAANRAEVRYLHGEDSFAIHLDFQEAS